MAWNFFKKVPVGRLIDGDRPEILFYAEKSVPDAAVILRFLGNAVPTSTRWRMPTNYVIRDMDHLEGWLTAFLTVEGKSLTSRFANNEKSFECWVIVSATLSALDIVFRLKTSGVSGHTQYTVSIIKLEQSEFLCVE